MAPIFLEITIIIILAAIISVVFKLLKQPVIYAYILTGIIIGPFGFLQLENQEFIKILAELGITFLLFMLGLEIRIKNFSSVGKTAIVVGISQIVLTFMAGYALSSLFGFSNIESFYLAIALTLSSTVIVVKLLSDKRQTNSLHGKITVGILLVQDFFAIMALIFLPGLGSAQELIPAIQNIGQLAFKGAIILGGVWFLSVYVFPKLIEGLARSTETLFLVSIAWLFGFATLVSSPYVGFSVEIGGFLAGLALSNSIANYQIIARAKILRDFFIVLFFVLLGTQTSFSNILTFAIPIITFCIFVLLVKPFIVMVIMGILGFRKRTVFLSGITLAQISEFSLILAFLGQRLGHISDKVASSITVVGIVTFAASAFLILRSARVYRVFNKYIDFLEISHVRREDAETADELDGLSDHVVVIGADQMGQSIIDAFEDMDVEVVAVDFDPEIFKTLLSRKIKRLYGDISDVEIQERAGLSTAKLVISTIPDLEDNLLLIKQLGRENRRAKVVVMALDSSEAKILYKAGADYVILPHLAGGRQVAKLIEDNNLDKIETLKNRDMKFLDLGA